MTNPSPLVDDDLVAYADRQLAPERVALVEAWIARDAQAAARVAEVRAQNAMLSEALDPVLVESIPRRLLKAARPPETQNPRWRSALALAAMLVVGIFVGWIARDTLLTSRGTPTSFAREAAFAHLIYASDQGRPVEITAQEEPRLVRWLTRRTGVQVAAPDLNSVGFALVGGRLVAGNQKPTGLFMYENAEKQRLTLQWRKVEPGTSEAQFRYAIEGGVGIFYWIDENCTYALSGNVDRAQLLSVARVVYGQLAAAYVNPTAR
ncbi:MAG TPA: anti-sigma factor [Casimicrobiaceae bacterium]|nr:anti-sigma factor [Casimicrobiaceae bacterium]